MELAQQIIGYTMTGIAIAALVAIIVARIMAEKEKDKDEKPPLIDIR